MSELDIAQIAYDAGDYAELQRLTIEMEARVKAKGDLISRVLMRIKAVNHRFASKQNIIDAMREASADINQSLADDPEWQKIIGGANKSNVIHTCESCGKSYPQTIEHWGKIERRYWWVCVKCTEQHLANQRKTHSRRRRALLFSAPGSHTAEDILILWEKSKHRCYWCGKRIKDGKYHVDHVMPLSKGGSDGIENLVIACPTCNMSKGTKLPQEMGVLF